MNPLSNLNGFTCSCAALGGSWKLAFIVEEESSRVRAQCYKWDPNNRQEVNFAITKDLLGDCGAFLRDGVDEQVSHICACCPSLICSQGHTVKTRSPQVLLGGPGGQGTRVEVSPDISRA